MKANFKRRNAKNVIKANFKPKNTKNAYAAPTKNRALKGKKRENFSTKKAKVYAIKNQQVPKTDFRLRKGLDTSNKREESRKDKLVKLHKRRREPFEDVEESSNSSGDEPEGNAGWADSIAKVLNSNKPKTKKSLVLSRAKKDNPNHKTEKRARTYNFEVDGAATESEAESEQNTKKKRDKAKERTKMMELRVKPSPTDYEEERDLRKVATRAVVQFFNAVNIQQKKLEVEIKKAGPLDHRKDAVYSNIDKKKFLDILKNTKPRLEDSPAVKGEIKEEDNFDDSKPSTARKGWSVLRPDYMTNKKLKPWDTEDTDEEGMNSDADIGSADDLE